MIKILLGKGDVLSGRLLVYDALKMSFKVYRSICRRRLANGSLCCGGSEDRLREEHETL